MKKKQNNNISKLCILTLGCSKNLVDSEEMLGHLKANNLTATENIAEADALIINTCGFIKPAKEESINLIMEACALKKRGVLKKLIVTGCLSERYMSELKAQIKEVDYFFGVKPVKELLGVLTESDNYTDEISRSILTPKHYAYLKIAEGCNHLCSFCSIPIIRGDFISRTKEEIVKEARQLVASGVKELNVIAQDTTFYGVDLYGKRKLADLLRELSDINDLKWLRLMYTFPAGFPEDVLDVMAERDNICKYIDIPLQHASDKILKSMRRAITRKQQEELIDKIRTRVPGAAIRSAFITGYPGETKGDFKELYNFIEEMQLDRVGVFIYSHEDVTPAYDLQDNISEKEKAKRRDILMELQQSISLRKNGEKVGKTIEVLIDDENEEDFTGRSQSDAPDVDNLIHISKSPALKPGDFVNIKITKAEEYDLWGEID